MNGSKILKIILGLSFPTRPETLIVRIKPSPSRWIPTVFVKTTGVSFSAHDKIALRDAEDEITALVSDDFRDVGTEIDAIRPSSPHSPDDRPTSSAIERNPGLTTFVRNGELVAFLATSKAAPYERLRRRIKLANEILAENASTDDSSDLEWNVILGGEGKRPFLVKTASIENAAERAAVIGIARQALAKRTGRWIVKPIIGIFQARHKRSEMPSAAKTLAAIRRADSLGADLVKRHR
jgi:hypothetical protein